MGLRLSFLGSSSIFSSRACFALENPLNGRFPRVVEKTKPLFCKVSSRARTASVDGRTLGTLVLSRSAGMIQVLIPTSSQPDAGSRRKSGGKLEVA